MKQRIKILALGCIMIVSSWMMVYASTAKLTATSAYGIDASCYADCTFTKRTFAKDYVTYFAMLKGSDREAITVLNPATFTIKRPNGKYAADYILYDGVSVHTEQKFFNASYVTVKVTCDGGEASKTLK